MLSRSELFFRDLLELVDHRDDQAAAIRIEDVLQVVLALGSLDMDVGGLHLAEQAVHPPLKLALQLVAVDDEDDGGVVEAGLVLEDLPGSGQKREGLARALGMPDEATGLLGVGAAGDDLVDRLALVLAQDRLLGLGVLDVEEDPVLQRAQEGVRLEERLDGALVGLVLGILPLEDEAPRDIPGDAVPVPQHVGDVVELGLSNELRRLLLVAAQLRDAARQRVARRWVLVLDDRHRQAVNQEDDIGPVALAGDRLDLPLPGDLELVVVRVLEVDELDRAAELLVLVVPLVLAADPAQDIPVALDGRRQRLDGLDDRSRLVGRQPRIEVAQLVLEDGREQHVLASVPEHLGVDRLDDIPADPMGMGDHGELGSARLADLECRHANPGSGACTSGRSEMSRSSALISPDVSWCSSISNSSSSTSRC